MEKRLNFNLFAITTERIFIMTKTILETKSNWYLVKAIFDDGDYQDIKHHYKSLFSDYARKGDTTNLKEDIDRLFSKVNGIPAIISKLTFENSNDSIYTEPQKVKDDLYKLKQKYFKKINWHVEHSNPRGIPNKFYELYNDLEIIPRRYLKRI